MVETEVLSRAASALSMRKDVNVNYTELQDYEDFKTQSLPQNTSTTFQAWPTQPKPLVLAQRDRILYMIFDIALIALPVCLIIKTGLCIYAYNIDKGFTGVEIDSVSFLSVVLIELNSQLVTLFTIVFVTIMSTFVKRYALWKAQKGAYVSELEQLQGSVSLPSTLKLIWSLRSFGAKSVILASVWSFYYLGSQAVKLEYRLALSDDFHKMSAVISRSDAPGYFSPDLAQVFQTSAYSLHDFKAVSYVDRLNIKFGSIILDSQDEQNQDLHGVQSNPGSRNGPLIPDYYTALGAVKQTSLTDKVLQKLGGWIDTSKQSQLASTYVSLTGRSLWLDLQSGKPGNITHDLEAESLLGTYTLYNISYLNVTCGYPVVYPTWAFPNGTMTNSSASFNMTLTSPNATKDMNGYPLRQFSYWYKVYTADPLPGSDPYNISDFTGTYNFTRRALQSTCSLSTKHVDMDVNCISAGCYPVRLRWASNTDEYNATSYSTPFDSDQFATAFLSNYSLSTGDQEDPDFPTLVEQQFGFSLEANASVWSTLGPARCLGCDTGVSNTTSFDQGTGLMHGFNTYNMLSQAIVADYIQPNITRILANEDQRDDMYNLVHITKGAPLNQGYRIRWQWIPVDFVACSILLAAAIGAYWLRVNTLAPDIFGYVSSLTRDNPHLQLPTEGSALSGIDRARMLRGVKVRIGDVQSRNMGESSVGRIGLAPVNAEVQPLYVQKVYM